MKQLIEALDLALESLEKISRTQYHIETPPVESLEEQMRRIADKAITAIKQARSAPVQSCYCPNCEAMGKELAALKAQPTPVPEPLAQNICIDCANADSWGLPDKPACRSCVSNSEWSPLNRSSVNPIAPPAQPAPVQEPVAFNAGVPPLYPEMKDGETISVEYTTPPAQPAPVQEPVAWPMEEQPDGSIIPVDPSELPSDYFTTPPAAQRQWVGLTEQELEAIWYQAETGGAMLLRFAEAIEAKLKEKNGLHRQHVIDGSPCWCEPETSYTDPETGASVVVHKEPQ